MSHPHPITRREFLRRNGIAASALTLSPFLLERLANVCQASASLTRVYKVQNGTSAQNYGVTQLLSMMGGIGQFVNPSDVVVIKGNAQWPNQGFTHTGCLKGVIDAILAIPGYSGQIIICDNIQGGGVSGQTGFDAGSGYCYNNWPGGNWTTLVQNYYQNKPVAVQQWNSYNHQGSTYTEPAGSLPSLVAWNPANGQGWHRYFFPYNAGGSSKGSFVSCPVFASPLNSGMLLDLHNGLVWQNGGYTGQKVKVIFMPNLNNHGSGSEDAAGVTSAIKCFFGATEIPGGPDKTSQNCQYLYPGAHFYGAHGDCMGSFGQTIGTMAGNFINNLYAPVLYITAGVYAGAYSRWDSSGAVATNTVLGCVNPVTLDYVSCRDVIAPYAPWLNPDNPASNTRQQILTCNSLGIGTINPQQFEVVAYDLQNPPAGTRLDIEQTIRNFKAGTAAEQDVKNAVQAYMDGD